MFYLFYTFIAIHVILCYIFSVGILFLLIYPVLAYSFIDDELNCTCWDLLTFCGQGVWNKAPCI